MFINFRSAKSCCFNGINSASMLGVVKDRHHCNLIMFDTYLKSLCWHLQGGYGPDDGTRMKDQSKHF